MDIIPTLSITSERDPGAFLLDRDLEGVEVYREDQNPGRMWLATKYGNITLLFATIRGHDAFFKAVLTAREPLCRETDLPLYCKYDMIDSNELGDIAETWSSMTLTSNSAMT